MDHYRSGPLIAAALTAALLASGCQTIAARKLLPRDGVRPAEHAVQVERGVVMRTADGVALVADVFRPKTAGRFPTILVRIPFTKTFKNSLGVDVLGDFWASRGYAVVIQGTRGRYKSGGEFYPMRHERQDGIETLRWLERRPWYDGRIGMWGGSAFGQTQWAIADQSEPGPSALFIQLASTDFRGMFHPGGAFSLESALFWAVRSRGARDEDPRPESLQRGFDGFPLIDADARAIADIPFFDDWLRHPQPDAYWLPIDGEDRGRTLRAPVLLLAGWYDPFLPTQLRDYETVRQAPDPHVAAGSRLIIGPWSHAAEVRFPDGTMGEDYRRATIAPSLAWFDHQLRGEPLVASLQAPVRLFVMGANVWRDEQEWPLARAQPTPFYLRAAGAANTRRGVGRLEREAPTTDEPVDSFSYDPRDPVPSRGGAMLGPRAGIRQQDAVEERPDVLVFTSAPLSADLEVTGPVKAVLHVATSAPNTDFAVKLVDVLPDDRAFNVTAGLLRRAYPPGGAPQEIVVELWPTSMLFRRGHRIRVEVSSSDYPRYDRNPNTGRDIATETSPVAATQTLHHDALRASRVILPIVPQNPAAGSLPR